eukprot:EST47433.1 hypothetical protein SS50377_12418 [Spironucleus salmonicida]
MRQLFNLSANKDQLIMKDQLLLLFQQLNTPLPDETDNILLLIDPQFDGTLTFPKFQRFYYISINEQDPTSILFFAADKNYDAQLLCTELVEFLDFLGYKSEPGDMLKLANSFASDGVVNQQRFQNLIQWLIE